MHCARSVNLATHPFLRLRTRILCSPTSLALLLAVLAHSSLHFWLSICEVRIWILIIFGVLFRRTSPPITNLVVIIGGHRLRGPPPTPGKLLWPFWWHGSLVNSFSFLPAVFFSFWISFFAEYRHQSPTWWWSSVDIDSADHHQHRVSFFDRFGAMVRLLTHFFLSSCSVLVMTRVGVAIDNLLRLGGECRRRN